MQYITNLNLSITYHHVILNAFPASLCQLYTQQLCQELRKAHNILLYKAIECFSFNGRI